MNSDAQPRLLIVDDDNANIELLAGIFDDHYDILFAATGDKALKIAPLAQPDVILLDVMMPEMDGFEVCTRLKADPLTRGIPVIFITGMGETDAETRGLQLGAMDYISKPINPTVVKMRVDNQVALKRARDQLAQLATTDGLTGLANRRRFDEVLDLEYARHARSGAELAVIMIDIDHFKLFNDTYGHLRGDDCLRGVAGVIREALHRATDLAARYGGEEFACILPDTLPAKGVLAVAERIRQGVTDLHIPHGGSSTAEHVTVSLGAINGRCTRDMPPSNLVALADQQLYQAKQGGRNRVCFASGTQFGE